MSQAAKITEIEILKAIRNNFRNKKNINPDEQSIYHTKANLVDDIILILTDENAKKEAKQRYL